MQIKQIVDEEMNAANQHMAFGVTSLVLVLMISPIIIFLVSFSTLCILELTYQSINWILLLEKHLFRWIWNEDSIFFILFQVRSATATIQIFSFSLSKKALELKNEKGKVHSLLFETLPRVIALEYIQVKLKMYPSNLV